MNLSVILANNQGNNLLWLWIILGVIVGLVAGFFISRWLFKRELQKNPPINEKMIRAMFMQMGRKPSEAQVRAIMNQMNKNK